MHNPGIQGLRAVAVTVVLLYHAGAPLCEAGWLGVDLFFVLSGFLITTLLLRERRQTGSFSLLRFWGRRALRLLPIYVLYAGAVTIAIERSPDVSTVGLGGFTPTHLVAALWTHTVNFLPIRGIWEHQQLTGHLWSLSVEEQFYFLWPPLLLALPALHRGTAATWALVAVSCAWIWFGYDGPAPVAMLHTRGIGLVIGCAIAVTLDSNGPALRRLRLISGPAASFAVAVAVAVCVRATVASRGHAGEFHVAGGLLGSWVPLFDLAIGVLVMNLWVDPSVRCVRWLSLRPLVFLGTLSYGMYLYHMLAHTVVWEGLLADIETWSRVPKFGARVALFYGLTVGVAWLSYRLVEQPFLRMKERLHRRPNRPSLVAHAMQPSAR